MSHSKENMHKKGMNQSPGRMLQRGFKNYPKSKNNQMWSPNERRENMDNWRSFKIDEEKCKNELRKFAKEGIVALAVQSKKHPMAKLRCNLCNYHLDTIFKADCHMQEKWHRECVLNIKSVKSLNYIPLPNGEHEAAVEEAVQIVLKMVALSPSQIEKRKEMVKLLQAEFEQLVLDLEVQMTGSSLNDFAINDSGLDVELVVPEGQSRADAFHLVLEKVKQNKEKYTNVEVDIQSTYPYMSFVIAEFDQKVVIGLHHPSGYKTNVMLQQYAKLDSRVIPLVQLFKFWAQRCGLDHPSEGGMSGVCLALMVIHFLQQLDPPVLPTLFENHPKFKSWKADPNFDKFIMAEYVQWSSENTSSVGALWLALLRTYAVDFPYKSHVVSVRRAEPVKREAIGANASSRLYVEDPFQQKRNQTMTMATRESYNYWLEKIRQAYMYFCTPQMAFGPLFNFILPNKFVVPTSSKKNEEDKEDSDEESSDEDIYEFSDNEDDDLNQSVGEGVATPGKLKPVDLSDISETFKEVTPIEAKRIAQGVRKDMLHFTFIFADSQNRPVMCSVCQSKGHTKRNCDVDKLPKPKALTGKPGEEFVQALSNLLTELKNECAPSESECSFRRFLVSDMQELLQRRWPKVQLHLFGSSENGFGFAHSDIDTCLTFMKQAKPDNLDASAFVIDLCKYLKNLRDIKSVLAIPTAKVPIVKLKKKDSDLDIDISIYNTLALENTRMLNIYAKIDPRVQVLGYSMKYLAKLCEMSDASRGSLSSYAYILMVIHYLQRTEPPVLPVLQKLYDSECYPCLPVRDLNGASVWFHSDLKTLPKIWPEYRKNEQSVCDLWLGMLRYYAEKFNFRTSVVTIRQTEVLHKLDKVWTTKTLAIEDPFDLTHNLGARLSRKMNAYIMTTFIKCRDIFCLAHTQKNIKDNRSMAQYLFNRKALTPGSPPNDRGCRRCGHIGHKASECTEKPKSKDANVPKVRWKEEGESSTKGQDKTKGGDDATKADHVTTKEDKKGKGDQTNEKVKQEKTKKEVKKNDKSEVGPNPKMGESSKPTEDENKCKTQRLGQKIEKSNVNEKVSQAKKDDSVSKNTVDAKKDQTKCLGHKSNIEGEIGSQKEANSKTKNTVDAKKGQTERLGEKSVTADDLVIPDHKILPEAPFSPRDDFQPTESLTNNPKSGLFRGTLIVKPFEGETSGHGLTLKEKYAILVVRAWALSERVKTFLSSVNVYLTAYDVRNSKEETKGLVAVRMPLASVRHAKKMAKQKSKKDCDNVTKNDNEKETLADGDVMLWILWDSLDASSKKEQNTWKYNNMMDVGKYLNSFEFLPIDFSCQQRVLEEVGLEKKILKDDENSSKWDQVDVVSFLKFVRDESKNVGTKYEGWPYTHKVIMPKGNKEKKERQRQIKPIANWNINSAKVKHKAPKPSVRNKFKRATKPDSS